MRAVGRDAVAVPFLTGRLSALKALAPPTRLRAVKLRKRHRRFLREVRTWLVPMGSFLAGLAALLSSLRTM